MKPSALVAGAGGFIGHHMVKFLKANGYWVRASTSRRRSSKRRRPTSSSSSIFASSTTAWPRPRSRRGLPARGRHGRDRLHHRVPRRRRPEQRADQRAHARGVAPERGVGRYFFSSSACIYPMYRQDSPDVTPAEGGGRLPRRPGGGVRLGEAVRGEALPVLPRGRQAAHARRSVPQHLRPARDVRGRAGEGACGHLPQGRARARTATRSRSGATGSRPGRSPTWTTAWRGSTASCARTIRAHSTSARTTSSRWTASSTWSARIAGKTLAQAARHDQAAGRARSEQRQLAAPRGARMGAADASRGRTARDLHVDRIAGFAESSSTHTLLQDADS